MHRGQAAKKRFLRKRRFGLNSWTVDTYGRHNPTMKVLAATVEGESQQFELSELLPVPAQGILEANGNV